MKQSYNWILHCTYFIAFILFVAACQDDANDPDDMQSEQNRYKTDISILFSPQGLGDHAYNDLILKGALEAQQETGTEVTIYSPSTLEEGEGLIEYWLYYIIADSTKNNALVIAGNEYEPFVKDWIERKKDTLTEELLRKILLFETSDTELPVYTFMINMYGASYIAGSIATLFTDSAAVIAANPTDLSLKRNVDGFRDGFLDNAGLSVATSYLASDFNGYSMPQEAYEQTDSLTDLNYQFIYPVAGGSNQGVYRYSREHPDKFYTAGMDVNLSAYSAHITFSTVKHVDQVVKKYIQQFCTRLSFGDIMHATYGIAERYADIDVVEDYQSSYKELIDYYYPIVAEKEQEYEKNLIAGEGGQDNE